MSNEFNLSGMPYYDEIRIYGARLLGNQTDEDDFVQEVYTRFIKSGKQIEGLHLRNMLFRIARNLAIDIFRKKKRIPINSDTDVEDLPQNQPNGADSGLAIQQQELLARVIAHLKEGAPNTRKIFYKRFVKGQNSTQIATALGLKADSVRQIISREISQIRERISLND